MPNHDLESIRAEVFQRNITRIYHFTQARKLVHILGDINGIASTEYLKKYHLDILDSTDPNRFDNHANHISCSIQYPNVWYLRNAREREQVFSDWVVLIIKPEVLWQDNVLFSPVNSATRRGSLLKPGHKGFKKLFLHEVSEGKYPQQRTKNSPLSCPTDGQAEVMIHEFIDLELITGIVVSKELEAQTIIERLEDVSISKEIINSLDWIFSPNLFKTDASIRNRIMRNGIFPTETLYRESNYDNE